MSMDVNDMLHVHDLCPVVEFFQERVKEPIEYRGQKARNVSSWC